MIGVEKPGLLTTVQDNGRLGLRKYGVLASGAMDPFAMRAANLLVGNEASAAGLEITLQGPELYFTEDALLAICGADFKLTINGEPLSMWRAVAVRKGSLLKVGLASNGCRAYLAIAGGLRVPMVMGSSSTYLRAELGGLKGRALLAGDRLEIGEMAKGTRSLLRDLLEKSTSGLRNGEGFVCVPWFVSSRIRPSYEEHPVIRVIAGREAEWFSQESLQALYSESYQVLPQSDRMGYRLQGRKLELLGARELITEAVSPGTIQVPPDGQPILLMADCQTTGGYPRIAHVIHADLPLAAQVKPGGRLRFREVSLREAQELFLLQEMDLRLLGAGVRGKMG